MNRFLLAAGFLVAATTAVHAQPYYPFTVTYDFTTAPLGTGTASLSAPLTGQIPPATANDFTALTNTNGGSSSVNSATPGQVDLATAGAGDVARAGVGGGNTISVPAPAWWFVDDPGFGPPISQPTVLSWTNIGDRILGGLDADANTVRSVTVATNFNPVGVVFTILGNQNSITLDSTGLFNGNSPGADSLTFTFALSDPSSGGSTWSFTDVKLDITAVPESSVVMGFTFAGILGGAWLLRRRAMKLDVAAPVAA